MKRTLGVVTLVLAAQLSWAEDWTRFRGPNGSGLSSSSSLPLTWTDTENIRWKVPLPGPGSSSPIVFGDRVFVSCYTGYGIDKEDPGDLRDLEHHLLCLSRLTGETIWDATVASQGNEDAYQGFVREHGYASSTPVTDGQHVYVLFGKTGVVAFDWDGRQKWLTNVGTKSDPYKWGPDGASLILYGDLVIANAANFGNAVVGLKRADGTEAWRFHDSKMTNCWSTPILVDVSGRTELVMSAPKKIFALDPNTGEELWFAESPIDIVCASLVEGQGVVYGMGGRTGGAIAIRCGGEGDVSESHTVWRAKLGAGIGTPVIVNGNLYWSSRGLAYCARCETGEEVFKERLSTSSRAGHHAGDYASPVAVGDKIVMVNRTGTTFIIGAATTLEKLAENHLQQDPGPFNATPAVSDGELFLRSDKMLYCIAS